MSEFIRDRVPSWLEYAAGEGITLQGTGKWRTAACGIHDGSDSLRVNTETQGWCCMACGAKGGDSLAHYMQLHGLDFITAARELGAYVDDEKPHSGTTKPSTLAPRDAVQLAAFELSVAMVVLSDARSGVLPNEADWRRFLVSVSRLGTLAEEHRA